MVLGDPQWAPMTVWIVALGSRGESLSKGRWRIVGTVLGMVAAVTLIAAVPQAPWLFFPALALWTGLYAGLATLVRNFRSYPSFSRPIPAPSSRWTRQHTLTACFRRPCRVEPVFCWA